MHDSAGWDAYAPFYDWENARTMGRRDIAFWQRLASAADGRVLELGCGTGRVLMPIARVGAEVIGVDRSAPMLARARGRLRRARLGRPPALVRADVRTLPFEPRSFALTIAAYGMLQSLLSDADLSRAIASVARVTRPGGRFGVDLVPDLPRWREHRRQVTLRGRGRGNAILTLVESVRQERTRGVTHFDEEYIERRGGARRARRFSLSFRTVPVPQMVARLERTGFRVRAVLGDYDGGPWHRAADVWVILAERI